MKTDQNGCSTCPVGVEVYETFRSASRFQMVQYDYRHPVRGLFSCVAKSLKIARARRDNWLGGSPNV